LTTKSTPNTSMIIKHENNIHTLTFPTIAMEIMFNHYRIIVNKRDEQTIIDFINNKNDLSLSFNSKFDGTTTTTENNLSLIQRDNISGKIEDTGMRVGEDIIGYQLFAENGEYVQLTFEYELSSDDRIRMFD